MDVVDWLRTLGLGQYEGAFRESDIDFGVLPELNDQHLKDLGVSLGHRLKMLRAIRTLAEYTPVKEQPARLPEAKPHAQAERRQLTVMFCDLVGSTALSQGMDPEDLRAVIRSFQDTAAGAIGRFEGHVAKFMGDGVLAYFGYPRAHEDDAERAVRAGIALVEAVGGLKHGGRAALEVRVGIATGLAVVGDIVGEGGALSRVVNLESRLEGLVFSCWCCGQRGPRCPSAAACPQCH
jgi:class 3 adenylate cyclase